MNSNVRITGDNPSPKLLEEYPNWEYALDEEGIEGQDETTLRPAQNQSTIGEDIAITAGTAWLNDGRECPAIIEMIDNVEGLQFCLEGRWRRVVRWSGRTGEFERWEPFVEHWLPETERHFLPLSLDDDNFFPLRFASRLPFHKTSAHIRIKILVDGGEESWS